MQAIETKFRGPTDSRGSRHSAKCEAGRITLNIDHRLSIEENHRRVARALINKLGWHGRWVGGVIPSNPSGFVFVCVQRHEYEGDKIRWHGPHEGFDVWPEEIDRTGE